MSEQGTNPCHVLLVEQTTLTMLGGIGTCPLARTSRPRSNHRSSYALPCAEAAPHAARHLLMNQREARPDTGAHRQMPKVAHVSSTLGRFTLVAGRIVRALSHEDLGQCGRQIAAGRGRAEQRSEA